MLKFTSTSIIVALLIISFPLIPYFYTFNQGLSDKTNDWSAFGDYLNGVLGPIVAMTGVYLTYVLWVLQKRDKRPFPLIHLTDFEHKVEVRLYNKGLGPLKIVSIRIEGINNENEAYNSFYNLIQILNNGDIWEFDNYSGDQSGYILEPGKSKSLLRFEIGNYVGQDFEDRRDRLRNTLCDYRVVIDFEDMYGDSIRPMYVKGLEWFGRGYITIEEDE